MAWRWTASPASFGGLFTDCAEHRLCPDAESQSGGVGPAALTFAGGAFLLVGLMTPFMAVLVAAGGIAAVLSWIPLPGQTLSDSYPQYSI